MTPQTVSRQDVLARIAALGAQFNPDVLAQTRAAIEALAGEGASQHGPVSEAYGDHPRQQIDIYTPDGRERPVLLYVPGGGFVSGDKSGYRRLGNYFAANGYLTLIGNYRLAPEVQWPAGAEDVAAMIDWAARQASRLGGDPSKIFVFGQSAGATHAAGALFDPDLRPRSMAAVRAAVLASGIYRITPADSESGITRYFSADTTTYPQRSPLTHVGRSELPLLLVVAEYDPVFLGQPTLELASAVYTRAGSCPPLIRLCGHNHVSYVLGIGTAVDDLGPQVLQFLGDQAS